MLRTSERGKVRPAASLYNDLLSVCVFRGQSVIEVCSRRENNNEHASKQKHSRQSPPAQRQKKKKRVQRTQQQQHTDAATSTDALPNRTGHYTHYVNGTRSYLYSVRWTASDATGQSNAVRMSRDPRKGRRAACCGVQGTRTSWGGLVLVRCCPSQGRVPKDDSCPSFCTRAKVNA